MMKCKWTIVNKNTKIFVISSIHRIFVSSSVLRCEWPSATKNSEILEQQCSSFKAHFLNTKTLLRRFPQYSWWRLENVGHGYRDGDLWIGSIGRFRFMKRMGGWWRRQVKVGSCHMMSEYQQIFVISGITCDMSRRTWLLLSSHHQLITLALLSSVRLQGWQHLLTTFTVTRGCWRGGGCRVGEDRGNTALRRRLAPARPGHDEELGKWKLDFGPREFRVISFSLSHKQIK